MFCMCYEGVDISSCVDEYVLACVAEVPVAAAERGGAGGATHT